MAAGHERIDSTWDLLTAGTGGYILSLAFFDAEDFFGRLECE